MQVIMKIGTLIVLEVFTFIIAVKDNVTLTSWITCPNSCNDTASTKFRMQLFKNTSGESSVQVSEIDGNVNLTGINIKWNDTERKRNAEPGLCFYICFNEKDIMDWLLIKRSIHKNICENFTLHNYKRKEVISNKLAKSSYWSSWTDNFTAFHKRNIMCTERQCRGGVVSCNCIYIVNSESKKEFSGVEMTTTAALETVVFLKRETSPFLRTEQSITTYPENGTYVQNRRSAPKWHWLMLMGSVIILVITLSFEIIKNTRQRRKRRNAKTVNN